MKRPKKAAPAADAQTADVNVLQDLPDFDLTPFRRNKTKTVIRVGTCTVFSSHFTDSPDDFVVQRFALCVLGPVTYAKTAGRDLLTDVFLPAYRNGSLAYTVFEFFRGVPVGSLLMEEVENQKQRLIGRATDYAKTRVLRRFRAYCGAH